MIFFQQEINHRGVKTALVISFNSLFSLIKGNRIFIKSFLVIAG